MNIPASRILLMCGSTLASVLLWFWVGAQERSEVIVNVPLQYRNLPRGLEITAVDNLLTSVNVWVRGTTTTIKNLHPEQISAWIDLQNAKAGTRIFELSSDSVLVPYGFGVLRISPSQVKLKLEETVSRTVPVVPRLEGEPPKGFAVTKTTVNPDKVEIVGPFSAVSTVRQVVTDSIDVSTVHGDRVEVVSIGVENNAVRLGRNKQVTVSLRVSEVEDLLTVRNIAVVAAGSTRPVKFNPKVIRVDLQAPKRILGELSEKEIQAVLELKGLNPGDYELTPDIVFAKPEHNKITVTDIVPDRIHVRIQ
jgi:YbbR domain-containing protein